MARRPEQRYGTASGALAADLDQWLAGETVGAWRKQAGMPQHPPLGGAARVTLVAAAAMDPGGRSRFVGGHGLLVAPPPPTGASRRTTGKRRRMCWPRCERGELERAEPRRRYSSKSPRPIRNGGPTDSPRPPCCFRNARRGCEAGSGITWPRQRPGRCGGGPRSTAPRETHGKEAWNVAISPRRRPRGFGRPRRDGDRVWESLEETPFSFSDDGRDRVETPGPSPGRRVQPRRRPAGDRRRPGRRLWDAATGRHVRSFADVVGEVHGVAFSPDGKTLAAAVVPFRNLPGVPNRAGGEVRLWDVASGKARDPLLAVSGGLTCVAFSPDGKTVAAGTLNRKVRRWDVLSGDEQESLVGHGSAVPVAFSPDGRLIASASNDGAVGIWDAATGKAKHLLRGHTMPAWGVAFSPDSRFVASSADDSTIKVWDAAVRPAGANTARPHGRHRQRRIQSRRPPISIGQRRSDGKALEGRRLADGSYPRRTQALGLERRLQPRRPAHRLGGQRRFGRGQARRRRGRPHVEHDGRELAALHVPGGSRAVVFSPDGKRLAAAGEDGTVHVWEANAGWKEHLLHGHSGKVLSVAFSPDGRLASESADHTVKIWDVAAEKEVFTLRGHDDVVRSAALGADGRRLASGGDDRVVKVWDAATGREERGVRPDNRAPSTRSPLVRTASVWRPRPRPCNESSP